MKPWNCQPSTLLGFARRLRGCARRLRAILGGVRVTPAIALTYGLEYIGLRDEASSAIQAGASDGALRWEVPPLVTPHE